MINQLFLIFYQLFVQIFLNYQQIKVKKKRPRYISPDDHNRRPFRRDYMSCSWWGEFINNPSIQDPNSFAARKFRRRFRVPFALYEDILSKASSPEPIGLGFKMRPISVAGIAGIPLELKILSVLRVLGRATCFDVLLILTSELDSVNDDVIILL
mmetsp:Transcript_12017/g.10856  ORF Transcript_12017/g.10856 Transcript_12017/m.10856 type:complete len:155 (+) Transcript_12017:99-563(+)